MKTVGVRDLKANLSAYLRDVTRGDAILVTDRGRVVAELRQPNTERRANLAPEAVLRERLAQRGLLAEAPPARTLAWDTPLPRLLKRGTAQQLLDEDRREPPR